MIMKEKRIFFILFLLIIPVISAGDVILINAGGDNQMCINAGGVIEDCFFCAENCNFCVPATCIILGHNCGTWPDKCSGTLNCGSCSSGHTCSSGTCTVISGGDTGGGGGGGGGGGTAKPKEEKLTDLKVIPEEFNLVAKLGIPFSAKISLLNLKYSELEIKVSLTNSLKNVISFEEETSFVMASGETRILNFEITPPSETGIYTGKIIFASGEKKLEVPFVLNVGSGLSLFDVSLDINEQDRTINVGERLKGQINLVQAGVQENVDVSVHYIVKDFEDNIYLEETETIMVYKQKSYEHEFNTQNLPAGDYVIGAEIIYTGGVATASYPFKVIEKTEVTDTHLTYIVLSIVLFIGIVLLLIILNYYKRQNIKYNIKKRRWKRR